MEVGVDWGREWRPVQRLHVALDVAADSLLPGWLEACVLHPPEPDRAEIYIHEFPPAVHPVVLESCLQQEDNQSKHIMATFTSNV